MRIKKEEEDIHEYCRTGYLQSLFTVQNNGDRKSIYLYFFQSVGTGVSLRELLA